MELLELQQGCADLLRELRISTNTSKAGMADAAGVDIKTWNKYESGESAPDVPHFLSIFNSLNKDALRAVLEYIYPETYDGLNVESSTPDLREALVHYVGSVASDREVRELSYLIHGGHGSNWRPQLEEFLMIDHLPMVLRYIIADQIFSLYRFAADRGELVCTDHIMPDEELFIAGRTKGRDAAVAGLNSYTTSM